MITLVGTPDPEPLATGGILTSWSLLDHSGCVVPWLSEIREDTVPLPRTTAASGNWTITINPQGEPA